MQPIGCNRVISITVPYCSLRYTFSLKEYNVHSWSGGINRIGHAGALWRIFFKRVSLLYSLNEEDRRRKYGFKHLQTLQVALTNGHYISQIQ